MRRRSRAKRSCTVTDRGQRMPLDWSRLHTIVASACEDLGTEVRPEPILQETRRNLYDGVPIDEVHKAAILAARTLIEKDPGYNRATARLLLHTIRKEILGEDALQSEMGTRYPDYFPGFIKKGVQAELLDEKLLQFDLARLGAALKPERDLQFDYLGLQTLYDRYFLHVDERPHRDAAGLLHARGDGPGAERDRPRGARDRVLRGAVELRLHEQHADAVQRRHAAARSCRAAT